jgi:hypothetical protein
LSQAGGDISETVPRDLTRARMQQKAIARLSRSDYITT